MYLAVARGPARFNKLLVVKQLKPELVEDSSFLEMFLEEARLAARLNHPNIVQTYEVGSDGDKHYMVMDYLEGVTLARVLKKKSAAFTLGMHLRVLCEALQGLHYAHTLKDFDNTPLGIVHRDATPQNLFVTYDGQVKVVDFGIAKALDSTVETSTGVLKGKPSYMAPEQIAGDVDPRADVFTAGVMLWEAIVGHRMWSKKSDVEILTNIIKGDVPKLKDEAPNAPDELARIVGKALSKNRDDRHESAQALQHELEKYLADTKTDVQLREIGKVVTDLFANERKAVKSTIEQHLAVVASRDRARAGEASEHSTAVGRRERWRDAGVGRQLGAELGHGWTNAAGHRSPHDGDDADQRDVARVAEEEQQPDLHRWWHRCGRLDWRHHRGDTRRPTGHRRHHADGIVLRPAAAPTGVPEIKAAASAPAGAGLARSQREGVSEELRRLDRRRRGHRTP